MFKRHWITQWEYLKIMLLKSVWTVTKVNTLLVQNHINVTETKKALKRLSLPSQVISWQQQGSNWNQLLVLDKWVSTQLKKWLQIIREAKWLVWLVNTTNWITLPKKLLIIPLCLTWELLASPSWLSQMLSRSFTAEILKSSKRLSTGYSLLRLLKLNAAIRRRVINLLALQTVRVPK